jgi:NAD+ synthase
MDLLLWARNHDVPAAEAAPVVDLTAEQVTRVYHDIDRKRAATRPLHAPPLLVREVPEIGV